MEKNEPLELLAGVTEVVAAYVSYNEIAAIDVPKLIQQIYRTLSTLKPGSSPFLQEKPNLSISIDDSIQPDYLVCLEDGRHLKMLKRHLKALYNMTPHQYRERWGLPADYPMVAPNYAKRRSALAKDNGLGMRRGRRQIMAA